MTIQRISSLSQLRLQNAWLTIGVFDGVHAGHQALIGAMLEGARRAASPAVLMTFDPHPAVVLGGRTDHPCLTTIPERLAILENLGLEHVIVQPFDTAFARQSASEFIEQVVAALDLRHLFIGYDFALGRDRQGDRHHLGALGQRFGYSVTAMEPLLIDGVPVSSSAIRQAILEGRLAEAAGMLGRHYSLTGRVTSGAGRGRTILFPTANLEVPPGKLVPPGGVYACRAWRGETMYMAATNIGSNPTFTPAAQRRNVEAYLLDFEGDLYGEEMRLEFIERLRPEQRFESVEALIAQIGADVARTRSLLQQP